MNGISLTSLVKMSSGSSDSNICSDVLLLHSPVVQLTSDWSIQSHTCTEPSEAADRSVRGRSRCQRWEVTLTASPGCDDTA